jgi:hypothetical protein
MQAYRAERSSDGHKGHAMFTKTTGLRTTRITVETDTFLVVREAKAALAWCPDCGAEVDVITVTRDSTSDPATAAELERWLQTGDLHLWHVAEGAVQICVTSVLRRSAQQDVEGQGSGSS